MRYLFFFFITLVLTACFSPDLEDNTNVNTLQTAVNHSYSNTKEVKTKHLSLELRVDFDNQILKGVARHKIENVNNATSFIVDTKDLTILKVTTGKENESETDYKLETSNPILGAPLAITIDKNTEYVNIYYKTAPESSAIGWLNNQQTMTGKPFLYTQGEAILTRSWIPIQDVSSNKITYDATIEVPSDLLALMSAENPTEKNEKGMYHFEMHHPIPSYLIALAVGDIAFEKVSENTGVYAETPWVKEVKNELMDMPKMLQFAEDLCGEYVWGRYDVLVLPYSFPFGGMENPCLTFLNPTVIVGDRSLVSVVAHELAHSWSGNLVTNKTWEDFWLNEGWTVYLEHRIMEALHGKEYSDMLSIIEWHEYKQEHKYYSEQKMNYVLSLKPKLEGKDPDDGMTSVVYGKGAFFFKTLEEKIGRERFDPFIKRYFEKYRFKVINTDEFLSYLRDEFAGIDKVVLLDEWVYGEDIPLKHYNPSAEKMTIMSRIANKVASNPTLTKTFVVNDKKYTLHKDNFSTQEWMHFLRQVPRDISLERLDELNKMVGFNDWNNAEILTEWFLLAIDKSYQPAFPSLEKFLGKVGRRKFLEPLYIRLSENKENKEFAKAVFEKSKASYHSVSVETIAGILK